MIAMHESSKYMMLCSVCQKQGRMNGLPFAFAPNLPEREERVSRSKKIWPRVPAPAVDEKARREREKIESRQPLASPAASNRGGKKPHKRKDSGGWVAEAKCVGKQGKAGRRFTRAEVEIETTNGKPKEGEVNLS